MTPRASGFLNEIDRQPLTNKNNEIELHSHIHYKHPKQFTSCMSSTFLTTRSLLFYNDDWTPSATKAPSTANLRPTEIPIANLKSRAAASNWDVVR